MTKKFMAVGVSGLLAASLALTGCGSRTGSADAASGSGAKKTVKIGVIAPLSGDVSAIGQGIKNSVDLAIKQANASNAIPGWNIVLAAEDDEAKPDTGKNAATKLTSDKDVVGIVGPYNSSVGQAVQPVTSAAKVTQISPANTNPSLTKGADLANPKRAYANYFRTCTTDDVQGPFAAKYLLDNGIKTVATIHDKKVYGQGLVTAFAAAFTKGGGTIVDAETINPDDKDFSAVLAKVKGANPAAIYYGGEYPQGGPLSQQAKNAGLKIPVMGGDGLYDANYIKLAGNASEGDMTTSVGAPAESLASAKQFLTDFAAQKYNDSYGAYGMYSYDAANAIINALKTSLVNATDASAARQATIDAVGKVSFDGASGHVAFDQYGDSTSRVLTVYKVTGGKWVAAKTEDFKQS